jgi:hypothetical protein
MSEETLRAWTFTRKMGLEPFESPHGRRNAGPPLGFGSIRAPDRFLILAESVFRRARQP